MAEPKTRWSVLVVSGALVAVALGIAVWLGPLWSGDGGYPDTGGALGVQPPVDPAAAPAPGAEVDQLAGEGEATAASALPPGGRQQVSVETLQALGPGEPFVLRVELPAAPEGAEPVPGIAASPDGRRIEIEALSASGEQGVGLIELPSDWLGRPGPYLVELRTGEKAAIPLRRFVVEVR